MLIHDEPNHYETVQDGQFMKQCVDILSMQPAAGVCDGTSHGIIRCSRIGRSTKYQCTSCKQSSICNCSHIDYFNSWHSEHESLKEELPDDVNRVQEIPKYLAVSCENIPYPLPKLLRELHNAYEKGEAKFPEALVPSFTPEKKCKHNDLFDDRDPCSAM